MHVAEYMVHTRKYRQPAVTEQSLFNRSLARVRCKQPVLTVTPQFLRSSALVITEGERKHSSLELRNKLVVGASFLLFQVHDNTVEESSLD